MSRHRWSGPRRRTGVPHRPAACRRYHTAPQSGRRGAQAGAAASAWRARRTRSNQFSMSSAIFRQCEMGLDEGAGGTETITFILVRRAPLGERNTKTIVAAAERLEGDRPLVTDSVERAADGHPVGG